jgi:hypothetical protein
LREVVYTRGSHEDGELCIEFAGKSTGPKGRVKERKRQKEIDRERGRKGQVGDKGRRGTRQ